ncbi:MAG: adenylylsulfate reductase [Gammaproteobacteria bacterium]|nr:adenylylsulfate reductase [Gammaproteobacteria bacterium]
MQMYVTVMIASVIVMTIADLLHKKSATYFFEAADKAEALLAAGEAESSIGNETGRLKQLSAGDKVNALVGTVAIDVATAGEFSNGPRRLVHIFTMWGFVLFVAATAIIIYGQAETTTLATAWNIGAIMLLVGSWGYWFAFKVDCQSEGQSYFQIDLRKDIFSLGLMGTSLAALGWEIYGGGTGAWFTFLIISTTALFGSVYWSKFSHMFFKPMAAYNKRIIEANGTNENLPHETRDDEWQQNRHSMELLKDAPMDMGLGIKRSKPENY